MAKVTVYYDKTPDTDFKLAPSKMIIRFNRGAIKWDKPLYIPLTTPFRRQMADDYYDEILSLTVTLGDLIRHQDRPGQFGIYFPYIVRRIEQYKAREQIYFEYDEVEQLIIQIEDIEEIMQMNIKPFYRWRSA